MLLCIKVLHCSKSGYDFARCFIYKIVNLHIEYFGLIIHSLIQHFETSLRNILKATVLELEPEIIIKPNLRSPLFLIDNTLLLILS